MTSTERSRIASRNGVRPERFQHLAELRRARTFLAFRHQQDLAAGLENVVRRRHALDRLIEREVQRMTGGGGDDDGVHRFVQRFEQTAAGNRISM